MITVFETFAYQSNDSAIMASLCPQDGHKFCWKTRPSRSIILEATSFRHDLHIPVVVDKYVYGRFDLIFVIFQKSILYNVNSWHLRDLQNYFARFSFELISFKYYLLTPISHRFKFVPMYPGQFGQIKPVNLPKIEKVQSERVAKQSQKLQRNALSRFYLRLGISFFRSKFSKA